MYWISPLSYAVRGIVVNEMNSNEWSTPLNAGAVRGISLGSYAMENRGFQQETWWVSSGGYRFGHRVFGS